MWITALLLGLAGSLHCVGMCSPLAMAVGNLRRPFVVNRLVYNGGRVLTYGIQGAIVASIGMVMPLPGFQNILAITLGAVLVLMGISGIAGVRIPFITLAIQKFTNSLKQLFQKFLQQKSYTAMLLLGSLNGLLPCGLTYLALTYCLTLAGAVDGFNFMLLFGAGTLPVMLGLASIVPSFSKFIRSNSARLTTIIFIVLGSLLIARVVMVHHPEVASSTTDPALCVDEETL